MAKRNQQLHDIKILLKQTLGQQCYTDEPRIKPPLRKRRGKKDTNSVSSNEEIFGWWASECDSDEEKRKAQAAKGAYDIEGMLLESGILVNM
jgi:hypothetical protein